MTSNAESTESIQSSIKLTVEDFYLSENLSDFHFSFKQTDDQYERIPAHKLLLVAASDVFRAMFNGSWKEKDEVEIVDDKINEFKEFLKFFYFGRVNVTMDNVEYFMCLGDKYNVPNCLSVCEKFIINSLTVDNVLWAYEIGTTINQVKLNKYCETIISLETNAVLATESFLECNRNVLSQIQKMEHLSCTEVELFEAFMRWVKVASGQDHLTKEMVQTELGDLFYGFRFGSMSVEEFGTLDPSYGHLFSLDEYREVIRIISSTESVPKKFKGNHQKRQGDVMLSSQGSTIECYRLLSTYASAMAYHIQNIEITKFSTNKPMFLVAFLCPKIYVQNTVNRALLNLTKVVSSDITIATSSDPNDSNKEIIFYEGKANLQSKNDVQISLPKPILIKSGFIYEIRMKQTPPLNCSAPFLLKSEVQIEPDIKIQFHDDPIVGSDDKIARGLIYSLIFTTIQLNERKRSTT